jgi:hypothetical protein
MTLEGRVKDEIKKFLRKLQAYFHMPVQNGMGAPALDFHTCIPIVITPAMVGKTIGVYVGIEAKAPGKQPTPRQTRTMSDIQDAGGIAICVDQQNINEEMAKCLVKIITRTDC